MKEQILKMVEQYKKDGTLSFEVSVDMMNALYDLAEIIEFELYGNKS